MRGDQERFRLAGTEIMALGRSRPAPRAATGPARFLCAVVEALLPEDAASAPNRVERVAGFVHLQIEALPRALRALAWVGLSGFRALVALRHAKGFCSLDLPTRRRVMRAWSYGPFPPGRQLFRVLRGPALLAWYDLPDEDRHR
jgi:hypothetical protein